MPLEVRQIGIRLSVGDQEAPPAPGDDGGLAALLHGQAVSPWERASIVNECVEAVLAELKMQSER